ncbi:unnamed protein product [Bemisia tabaci]|uniref:Glucosidase 2 subunit beta n=1 Tax=Bemisia tabaci TaxID=7038 RepID=A0A9P0AF82_BEMTA|nr:unnamed protein product [Bemisia tabaci]
MFQVYDILLVFQFILSLACSSSVLKPRGVALSKASLYVPNADFTCFDGSYTIPFVYVNDDYCDCQDGSDEPGTSACPNGTFYCTNAGHTPQLIPSSRVNDGICDCCDGTDEYATHANCVNNCDALGYAAREEARQKEELVRQGSELMRQLSDHGKKMKKEKQERLHQLEKQKQEAEYLKQEKEKLKAEAESSENVALEKYRLIEEQEKKKVAEEEKNAQMQEIFKFFSDIDQNHDEIITIDEVQAYGVFDTNKDGVISDEEVQYFLGAAESYSWSQFHDIGWPRLKPLLIAYQQQVEAENQQQTGSTSPKSNDFDDQDRSEESDHEPDHEPEEEEGDEGDLDDKEEEDHASEEPSPDHSAKYDEETQQLIESANRARSEYDEAERAVRDIEREKKQIEDSINKDYGSNEEFAPLEGECFEYTDREYTYKFCPFDQISQRPVSGGMETRLGNWAGWIGPNKYDAMKYDGGQTCWNGPPRSAHINILCGLESALISASEPNRCEYLFDFITPAACHLDLIKQYEQHEHDEL